MGLRTDNTPAPSRASLTGDLRSEIPGLAASMRKIPFDSPSWVSGAVLLGLLVAPAAAVEAEAGATYEHLTNDQPDWRSLYLDASQTFAPRQTLYGTVRETERFALRDVELAAGYAHPFGAKWTTVIEASYSPDHNVLPESSVFGQLFREAGGGWVFNGGARFNTYTGSDARTLSAGVERYIGHYRVAYTYYNGKPEDASAASSHRVGFDYYYFEDR